MEIELEAGLSPEELAAWVEETVGPIRPPGGYELQPGECTARSFQAVMHAAGRDMTRKQAYDALERMVELGKMDKRKEFFERNMTNVYRRVEDKSNGAEVYDRVVE